MSISVRPEGTGKLLRSAGVYALWAAGAVVFDRIYALFSHGVASASMSLMFLYPLLGGALPALLLACLRPEIASARRWRLLYNVTGSGLAILTVGSLLRGILEIAGTGSAYLLFFTLAGGGCLLAGGVLFLVILGEQSAART